jgi:pyruvate dehydrogenase E1 component alpha subunit
MATTAPPTQADTTDLPVTLLLKMYETMRRIRSFDDAVHELFAAGELPGFVHVYVGEEAVASGVMLALNDDDYITSTHRGHGHCVAKGVDLGGMMAELYGRATGICKGKGGSMHIADFSKGMLGANGIVAGGTPIAIGAALSAQMRGSGQVAVCFFGDGATNEGIFHESLNLASIWDLPCVFVCENNGYAQSTATCYAMNVEHLAERSKAYNIPGVIVDGQDVVAVYRASAEAIQRARSGKGPTLLECKVLRFYGHYEGDADKYRTKQAVADLRQRDPLKLFADNVAPAAGITAAQLTEIDQRVTDELEKAKAFARNSPAPAPEDCLKDVYVDY